MREIKFRAWDKKYKEMIPDIWIAPEYGWLVLSDNDALAERERPGEDQIILMQYTGLKDKNGKEIYEGDVVKIVHPFKNRKYIGEIIWDEWCFNGKDFYFTHFDYPSEIFSQGTEYIEIIGNVYENPELIKEK